MKSPLATALLLPLIAVTVSGCDLMGDMIEFGFWLAIIVIGLVAFLIFMIVRWVKRR